MTDNKTIIPILAGPTGIGKTELSLNLAKRLNGEIISADSMQIYKGMDIGTAKITDKEADGIKHHIIDVVNPDERFSVSEFKDLALKKIEEILAKGKLPIIVGGTGLYISSIIYDFDFSKDLEIIEENNDDKGEENKSEYEEKMIKFRKDIHARLESGDMTKDELYEKAFEIDPKEAEKIDRNNIKRLIRILEIYNTTGKTKTEMNKIRANNLKDPDGYIYETDKYKFIVFELKLDREELYDRINIRVDKMLEDGLVEESERILSYLKDNNKLNYLETTSIQAIGYKEIVKYLEGEIDYDEAVRILKRNSRRYAKRQLTYFRKIKTFELDKRLDNDKLMDIISDNIN